MTIAERFWAKVAKTEGCWEWTGSTYVNGYGSMSVALDERRTCARAHRISWELHYGAIPTGMHVCHHCDNRKCVRPNHLFLGTRSDNMQDAKRKGRLNFQARPDVMPRGERHGRARLTAEQVLRFRARAARGESCAAMARAVGVNPSTVQKAVAGKNWPTSYARDAREDRR